MFCKGAIYYLQNLQVVRSGAERVYLSGVNWATEGAFRCEVTADDFETVADSRQSNVVGETHCTGRGIRLFLRLTRKIFWLLR